MSLPAVSLSEIERGAAWVQNFPVKEQEAAERLLSAIEIISESDFRSSLREKLTDLRREWGNKKVGAFPVQGLPGREVRKAYYQKRADLGADSGSGLIIENILSKTDMGDHLHLYPSVEQMRETKTDILLFVTDTIGSGREVLELLKFVTANPSIRSWISSKHIRLVLVTHSITERAWELLHPFKRILEVHYVQPALSFETSGWTKPQRDAIESLCREYAHGGDARGFEGATSLTIYQHTVTNGLPRILLQTKRNGGGSWSPLLPAKRKHGLSPEDERRTSGYAPVWFSAQAINSLQEGAKRRLQKLERDSVRTSFPSPFKPLVILLVCLRVGITPKWRQLRFTRMAEHRWDEILHYAINQGYVTRENRITPAGEAIVRKFGKMQLQEAKGIAHRSEESYYPKSLR